MSGLDFGITLLGISVGVVLAIWVAKKCGWLD